jgi:hypothetical protein
MENVVVQVLNKEHGKEVIQTFKDLGVDTYKNSGSLVGWYYGLFDGEFDSFTIPKNSKVITLEELEAMKQEEKPAYPCMMEVWDDEGEVDAREVIAEFKTPDGDERYVAISEDGYNCYTWQHARPIQPDPLKTVLDILKYQVSKVDNEAKADIASWIGSMGVLLTPNEAQLILDALEKNEK